MSFLDRIRSLSRQGLKAVSRGVRYAGYGVHSELESRARDYFYHRDVWHAVASSNVHSVAFYLDLESRRTVLGVRFSPRGVLSEYWYLDVPLSLWSDFLAAASKGRFVHEDLKSRYETRGPFRP